MLGKPTAVIVESSYPTILSGEDVKLTCKVSGSKVDVNWKKNGLPVPKNKKVRVSRVGDSSTLVISNVESDDSGDYSCEARNPAGYSSSTVKIRVTGRVILFSYNKDSERKYGRKKGTKHLNLY